MIPMQTQHSNFGQISQPQATLPASTESTNGASASKLVIRGHTKAQLLKLAVAGMQYDQMAAITGLPAPAIRQLLYREPLTPELEAALQASISTEWGHEGESITLLPHESEAVNSYGDLCEAIQAARARQELGHHDKAANIQKLLLQKVQDELEGGRNISFRNMMEGLRVVGSLLQTGKASAQAAAADKDAGRTVQGNVVNNVRISLHAGGSGGASYKPILDENSRVIGIESAGGIRELVNMSVDTLRQVAGTELHHSNAAAVREAQQAQLASLKSEALDEALAEAAITPLIEDALLDSPPDAWLLAHAQQPPTKSPEEDS